MVNLFNNGIDQTIDRTIQKWSFVLSRMVKTPNIFNKDFEKLFEISELPQESILFQNFVFENIDKEDLFDIGYLQELFLKKLKPHNKFSWEPTLKKKDDKIIIRYKNFKIYFSQKEVYSTIKRNDIIIDLNLWTKAQKEWDKNTIFQMFYVISKLDWFVVRYDT